MTDEREPKGYEDGPDFEINHDGVEGRVSGRVSGRVDGRVSGGVEGLPELCFCGEALADRDRVMVGVGVAYALGILDIMMQGSVPKTIAQGVAGVAYDTVGWPMDDASKAAAIDCGGLLLDRTRAIGKAMMDKAKAEQEARPKLTVVKRSGALLGPDGRRLT